MPSHPGAPTPWPKFTYSSCVVHWGQLRSSRGHLCEKKGTEWEPEGCFCKPRLALQLCQPKLLLICPLSMPPSHPCPLKSGTRRTSAFPGSACPRVSIITVSLVVMTLFFSSSASLPPSLPFIVIFFLFVLLLSQKSLDSVTQGPENICS